MDDLKELIEGLREINEKVAEHSFRSDEYDVFLQMNLQILRDQISKASDKIQKDLERSQRRRAA